MLISKKSKKNFSFFIISVLFFGCGKDVVSRYQNDVVEQDSKAIENCQNFSLFKDLDFNGAFLHSFFKCSLKVSAEKQGAMSGVVDTLGVDGLDALTKLLLLRDEKASLENRYPVLRGFIHLAERGFYLENEAANDKFGKEHGLELNQKLKILDAPSALNFLYALEEQKTLEPLLLDIGEVLSRFNTSAFTGLNRKYLENETSRRQFSTVLSKMVKGPSVTSFSDLFKVRLGKIVKSEKERRSLLGHWLDGQAIDTASLRLEEGALGAQVINSYDPLLELSEQLEKKNLNLSLGLFTKENMQGFYELPSLKKKETVQKLFRALGEITGRDDQSITRIAANFNNIHDTPVKSLGTLLDDILIFLDDPILNSLIEINNKVAFSKLKENFYKKIKAGSIPVGCPASPLAEGKDVERILYWLSPNCSGNESPFFVFVMDEINQVLKCGSPVKEGTDPFDIYECFNKEEREALAKSFQSEISLMRENLENLVVSNEKNNPKQNDKEVSTEFFQSYISYLRETFSTNIDQFREKGWISFVPKEKKEISLFIDDLEGQLIQLEVLSNLSQVQGSISKRYKGKRWFKSDFLYLSLSSYALKISAEQVDFNVALNDKNPEHNQSFLRILQNKNVNSSFDKSLKKYWNAQNIANSLDPEKRFDKESFLPLISSLSEVAFIFNRRNIDVFDQVSPFLVYGYKDASIQLRSDGEFIFPRGNAVQRTSLFKTTYREDARLEKAYDLGPLAGIDHPICYQGDCTRNIEFQKFIKNELPKNLLNEESPYGLKAVLSDKNDITVRDFQARAFIEREKISVKDFQAIFSFYSLKMLTAYGGFPEGDFEIPVFGNEKQFFKTSVYVEREQVWSDFKKFFPHDLFNEEISRKSISKRIIKIFDDAVLKEIYQKENLEKYSEYMSLTPKERKERADLFEMEKTSWFQALTVLNTYQLLSYPTRGSIYYPFIGGEGECFDRSGNARNCPITLKGNADDASSRYHIIRNYIADHVVSSFCPLYVERSGKRPEGNKEEVKLALAKNLKVNFSDDDIGWCLKNADKNYFSNGEIVDEETILPEEKILFQLGLFLKNGKKSFLSSEIKRAILSLKSDSMERDQFSGLFAGMPSLVAYTLPMNSLAYGQKEAGLFETLLELLSIKQGVLSGGQRSLSPLLERYGTGIRFDESPSKGGLVYDLIKKTFVQKLKDAANKDQTMMEALYTIITELKRRPELSQTLSYFVSDIGMLRMNGIFNGTFVQLFKGSIGLRLGEFFDWSTVELRPLKELIRPLWLQHGRSLINPFSREEIERFINFEAASIVTIFPDIKSFVEVSHIINNTLGDFLFFLEEGSSALILSVNQNVRNIIDSLRLEENATELTGMFDDLFLADLKDFSGEGTASLIDQFDSIFSAGISPANIKIIKSINSLPHSDFSNVIKSVSEFLKTDDLNVVVELLSASQLLSFEKFWKNILFTKESGALINTFVGRCQNITKKLFLEALDETELLLADTTKALSFLLDRAQWNEKSSVDSRYGVKALQHFASPQNDLFEYNKDLLGLWGTFHVE
jgi:hypothetical protein